MNWIELVGNVGTALFSVWLLLLGFRVLGKRPGQDAEYDRSLEFWSGTLKVMGVLGLVSVFFYLVASLVAW